MGFRTEDCLGLGGCAPSLSAWLVYFEAKPAKTLSGLALGGLHERTGHVLAGDGFAARSVFRPAAFGSHGATFVAHVGGPAVDPAGHAAPPAAARAAQEIR